MARESLDASLKARGLAPQSLSLTGEYARVQLNGVPFASVMLWLDGLRREGRVAVQEAKITAQTKLLILNTPHNPTGGMLQPADLDAIAEILARHPQVWVFADEIYSRLAYAGAFDSLATRRGMQERTIVSDGYGVRPPPRSHHGEDLNQVPWRA